MRPGVCGRRGWGGVDGVAPVGQSMHRRGAEVRVGGTLARMSTAEVCASCHDRTCLLSIRCSVGGEMLVKGGLDELIVKWTGGTPGSGGSDGASAWHGPHTNADDRAATVVSEE